MIPLFAVAVLLAPAVMSVNQSGGVTAAQINSVTLDASGGFVVYPYVPPEGPRLAHGGDHFSVWPVAPEMKGESDLWIVSTAWTGVPRSYQVLQSGVLLGDISSDLVFLPGYGTEIDATTERNLRALLHKWRPTVKAKMDEARRKKEAERRAHEAEVQKWREEAR